MDALIGTPSTEPAWWSVACTRCGWATSQHRNPSDARHEAATHHCEQETP